MNLYLVVFCLILDDKKVFYSDIIDDYDTAVGYIEDAKSYYRTLGEKIVYIRLFECDEDMIVYDLLETYTYVDSLEDL